MFYLYKQQCRTYLKVKVIIPPWSLELTLRVTVPAATNYLYMRKYGHLSMTVSFFFLHASVQFSQALLSLLYIAVYKTYEYITSRYHLKQKWAPLLALRCTDCIEGVSDSRFPALLLSETINKWPKIVFTITAVIEASQRAIERRLQHPTTPKSPVGDNWRDPSLRTKIKLFF